ncbi:PhoX family phosphatase [Shimia litoralis]|uniref:PhoX family phosphatase n=1 Tax=Shimia litoralis TaxID=420403 RepID=A0A4U7N9F8_9RHOB|nr:PhoX family phosphatase [Shimia litoralis]TKZ22468.1 PhoX family phosphatase [Shimia litoralis]
MDREDLSFDAHDELINPRAEETDFDQIVDTALSRRGFLGGVLTFGLGSFLVGTTALTRDAQAADRFGFAQIPTNTSDTITLPKGFEWEPVVQWGDPLFSDTPEFDDATRGTAASQARAFGDNNDGMSTFTKNGRTVMAVNNEYTNRKTIWGNRPEGKPADADDIEKGMMAHGISVFEVAQDTAGHWQVVKDSDLNRRITPRSEIALTGPAAGHDLLKTDADPSGTKALGTWNNCGNGETPWGTYLTCEENFNGYFSAADEDHAVSAELKRYGISSKDWGYGWAKVDERFDVSKNPNEPNRAGYVVEIDPFDPTSTPKKRTALGRFKHENAEVVIAANGKAVVYLGDDERGEFLYRFVSEGTYSATGDNSDLLETGALYVAKFHDDLRGEWLALTPDTTGMTEAEIRIHTRQAASSVGATTMDRPEWVAVNPTKVESYVALTNNKNRGKKPNKGGDDTSVNGPNPRDDNRYGQILRWVPDNADHAADGFAWDLYALAGNPDVHDDAYAGSENINSGNMFNSPDGMAFDSTGLLWIQTDGKYSNEGNFAGMGNNQMLCGDTTTGEIRRFLVGPKECEVTGLCWSPDRRTMFVGIQHPGEKGNSHFPRGGSSVPRSGVFAVRRTDGGLIG